jgi:hypothetical protein
MALEENYDKIVSAIVLIIIFIGIVYLIINYRKLYKEYKKIAPFFIFAGILLPVIAVLSNSYVESNWHKDYIISFLLFKRVTGKWFFIFNKFCMWGYISLSWGIVMLLLSIRGSGKEEKKER